MRPQKLDLHRTRINVGGNRICYHGDVSTPTDSLEIIKFIINIVLSRRNERFIYFDTKNFYLETNIKRAEYVSINISNIPQ